MAIYWYSDLLGIWRYMINAAVEDMAQQSEDDVIEFLVAAGYNPVTGEW